MLIQKFLPVLFRNEKKEDDGQGNEIVRAFYPSERYVIDFAEDYHDLGWQQFDTDQDAHYFGTWVNPKTLQELCYCEGDWSLVTCKDAGHYNAKIWSMIEFYGEGKIATVIDAENGSAVRFVQDRKKFFIKECVS